MTADAMRVEGMALTELIARVEPRNARVHDLPKIKESLAANGFVSPPMINEKTGRLVFGHGRVKALVEMRFVDPTKPPARVRLMKNGDWSVPTLRGLSFDSQSDALRYLVADNRMSELASWEMPDLGAMLSELRDQNKLIGTGYSSDDVDAILKEVHDALNRTAPGDDSTPEPPVDPITKLGDVWKLGDHRLHCGDGRTVDASGVGCVVTDPPYGVGRLKDLIVRGGVVKRGMVGAGFGGKATKGEYESIAGDEATPDVRWLLERAPVAIIWGGNYFADQLPPSGSWLVWDKRDDSGIENIFADCELAWSSRTGPARVHRQLWSGMIRAGEHTKREHPTQKPIALMEWCLGFVSGKVFDPFAGSGSTLIAAERQNRASLCAELSPAYCDVIVQRWEEASGGNATRVSV